MTDLPARWPEKVWAHHNLHTKQVSIRDPRTRRVIASVPALLLGQVTFHVSQKRRQAVIACGRREVHAYVAGAVVDVPHEPDLEQLVRITYNPFRLGAFHLDGDPTAEVWSAPRLLLTGGYAYAPTHALTLEKSP